jgi:hypothetical protein
MEFTKRELKIFLTVFIIGIIFIHWTGWNESARIDLTRAIIDESKLQIDTYYNNTSDRAHYDGHYYIEKSPIASIIIAPSYATWKFIYYNFISGKLIKTNTFLEYNTIQIGNANIIEVNYQSFFILFFYLLAAISYSVIPTALTVILIYKISKIYLDKEWQRVFVSFAYWLSTIAFYYSLILFNHPFPTFLTFLSFYILFSAKKGTKNRNISIFIAGALVGFAITNEAAIVCFFIPFLFYVLYLYKFKVFIFVLAVLIGFLLLMTYNYIIFKNPLKVTWQYLDYDFWQGSGLKENFGFNKLPNPFVFMRLFIYPERGLFFYSPFLLLAIFGFYFMFQKNKVECLMILSMLILIIIFISAYKSWWEYSSFGPRRIFAITPFLMLPVIISIKKIRFDFIFILFFVSTIINIASLAQRLDLYKDTFVLPDSVTPNPEVIKKVNSFEIVENSLRDHYFPLFIEDGPRSRLVESFFVKNHTFDMRDYWISSKISEQPKILSLQLFTTPFGFLSMKISFITTIIVAIIVSLIWEKCLLRFILKYKYLFVILCLLFFLYFFSIKDVIYEKHWFDEETFKDIRFRWMSNNASIKLYSPKEEKQILQFNLGSFYNDRTIEMYVNNALITTYFLKGNETERLNTPLIELKHGENIIMFHSVQECSEPSEIGIWKNDYRCLSAEIFNFKKL